MRAAQVVDRDVKTDQLHQQLILFLHNYPGCWGTYASIPGEISLNSLSSLCPAIQFAYPKVVGSELEFWIPGDKGFAPEARWGILEPIADGARQVSLAEMSGYLVPGLGFDKRGVRLGWGKGFYDRALSGFSGLKVGIAFAELVQTDLPCEDHDVRMDFLVTELGTLKVV